jgi:hypothetical protein
MVIERSSRRMTLRQQLTHAEKCSRDLVERLGATNMPLVTDLRDLTRPVRRRSHYPSLVAVNNALQAMQQAHAETVQLVAHLDAQLQEIREHARRERINRR